MKMDSHLCLKAMKAKEIRYGKICRTQRTVKTRMTSHHPTPHTKSLALDDVYHILIEKQKYVVIRYNRVFSEVLHIRSG